MNKELIEKLFEDSTGMSYPCRSENYDFRSMSSRNINQFAEAIIKECMNTAAISDDDENCPWSAWKSISLKFVVKR